MEGILLVIETVGSLFTTLSMTFAVAPGIAVEASIFGYRDNEACFPLIGEGARMGKNLYLEVET